MCELQIAETIDLVFSLLCPNAKKYFSITALTSYHVRLYCQSPRLHEIGFILHIRNGPCSKQLLSWFDIGALRSMSELPSQCLHEKDDALISLVMVIDKDDVLISLAIVTPFINFPLILARHFINTRIFASFISSFVKNLLCQNIFLTPSLLRLRSICLFCPSPPRRTHLIQALLLRRRYALGA